MKFREVINTRTLLLPSLALNVALLLGLIHLERRYDDLASEAVEASANFVFSNADSDDLDSGPEMAGPKVAGEGTTEGSH